MSLDKTSRFQLVRETAPTVRKGTFNGAIDRLERELSGSTPFHVDPDTGPYANISDAYTAAVDRSPDGAPVLLTVTPGKTHSIPGGTLNVLPGRAFAIQNTVREPEMNDLISPARTTIAGDIVLPPNDGYAQKQFSMSNVTLLDDIYGDSNWYILLNEVGLWGNRIFRTHGTAGCRFAGNRLYANSGSMRILDADAAPGVFQGAIQVYNSRLQCELSLSGGKSETMFDVKSPVIYDIIDCWIALLAQSGSPAFIDSFGGTASVTLARLTLLTTDYGGGPVTLFKNNGSAFGRFEEVHAIQRSAAAIDVGGDFGGGYFAHDRVKVIGPTQPTTPQTGTVWEDKTVGFATQIYNGAIWVPF